MKIQEKKQLFVFNDNQVIDWELIKQPLNKQDISSSIVLFYFGYIIN